MKLVEELIGELETALDKYKYEKYGSLELDEDTEQEIFNECKYLFNDLKEKLEELDGTIDDIIEEANEPSNYEFDWNEDVKRHLDNLTIRR